MASLGVGAAAAAYAWNPFLTVPVMAVAGYLDQQFLYPAILGKGKEQAKTNPLVGLPTTTNTPGTPRVWAMGRRVRVPLHVMYQSEKTREQNQTGPKGGVVNVIKRVFADVGLSVNDRRTTRLTQLIANGQLVYWSDKNLVRITTDQMTGTFTTTTVATGTTAAGTTSTSIVKSGGGMTVDTYARNYRWVQLTSGALSGEARPIIANSATALTVDWAFSGTPAVGVNYSIIEKRLVLTMNSSYEPDFTDYLVEGDIVDLQGFASLPAGAYLAGRTPYTTKSWWRVNAITAHGATPSSITLEAMIGQDIGPMTGVVAGNTFSPASVVREDTSWLVAAVYDSIVLASGANAISLSANDQYNARIRSSWARFMGTSNQKAITYTNWQEFISSWGNLSGGVPGVGYVKVSEPTIVGGGPGLLQQQGAVGQTNLLRPRCANNTGVVQEANPQSYEGRMFATNPLLTYYEGNDSQDEDEIILRKKTSGEVPGFRGMAYQMLDQWDLSTYFGNQVPPIVEAIIEPDGLFSLPNAILEICKRAESPDLKFDTAGVDVAAFEGYWTQGAIPTVTALQPLLTAFQIAAQERNDTVAFFNIENADTVQIENGATFSDLGVQSGADTPSAGDKIKVTQRDTADLPTSVGVTHQDPDQQYAQGYQHFKQRQPSPLPSNNEQNVNLDNLVLTRKQARNLAGTIMRRAWVNGTALEMQLPIAYAELLENDLITVTADDGEISGGGQVYTARVIRREIGNNYVVNVYAVVEDVALAVRGSPVQGPSNIVIGTPTAVDVQGRVLDIPPLVDEDAFVPGYYVAGCSPNFAAWGGAVVYESRDSGTTWQQVTTLNTRCGMGILTTTLPSGTPGDNIGSVAWDSTNSFTVRMDDYGPLGAPYTVTTTDVLNGFNWMLIEDGNNFEILGARDAVDNGDGTFTFDYLVRGLRGTYDSAATTKAVGSKVTFLFFARQSDAIKFIPTNLSAGNLPTTIQVKFVAPGQTLADVTAQTVTLDCWNARPMPGRMFTTEYDVGTLARTFVFEPFTRLQQPVGSGGPYTLDETYEGYTVRIYDPTGVTLMRTKTVSSGPTGANRLRTGQAEFLYSAAEQTADGYTPGPTETFKVERVQLGDFGEGRSWMEDV